LPTIYARKAQKAVYVLGLLGLAAQCVLVLLRPEKYQWDFRAYFYATQLLRMGQDPYDFDALAKLAESTRDHDGNLLPFIYPPHAFVWFFPLGGLSHGTAYYIYAALKFCALLAFLVMAHSWVKSPWWRAAMPIFALLLFGGAIPADLRSGNVALFETALLFAGFAMLIRGRSGRFAILAVLACSWKAALAPFVATPLLVRKRRPWVQTGAVALVIPALLLLSWLFFPALNKGFLEASGSLVDGLAPRANRAALNASSVRIFADVSYLVRGDTNFVLIGICYAVWAVVVIWFMIRTWRKFDLLRDQRVAIAYLVLTYGLLVPRLPLYSYALMIIPCIFVLEKTRYGRARWIISCFGCMPFFFAAREIFNVDPLSPATSFVVLPLEYSNFLVLVACWSLVSFTASSFTASSLTASQPDPLGMTRPVPGDLHVPRATRFTATE
jgi:hypothetical protein